MMDDDAQVDTSNVEREDLRGVTMERIKELEKNLRNKELEH